MAIFAATANNLADETVWALKEIQRAKTNNNVNVIVRFASIAKFEYLNSLKIERSKQSTDNSVERDKEIKELPGFVWVSYQRLLTEVMTIRPYGTGSLS